MLGKQVKSGLSADESTLEFTLEAGKKYLLIMSRSNSINSTKEPSPLLVTSLYY